MQYFFAQHSIITYQVRLLIFLSTDLKSYLFLNVSRIHNRVSAVPR